MRKLILASLTISAALTVQAGAQSRGGGGSLQQRLTRLLDQPPFDRATWNVFAQDDRGRVLFNRNGDRFSVPASNTKLVVSAAATVLLPADYRARSSVYANGTITTGVLQGDLILYGRGDPTWSQRCYTVDTLAPGGCDSTWTADLTLFTFENRARTVAADSSTTIGDNFFRRPGTLDIWAEGTVSLSRSPWIESFALPDPNLYAARALEISLRKKGISVGGGAAGTTDSMVYRSLRCCGSPLVEYRSRPLPDIVFPILNTSQNWFAEMLLKVLAREVGDTGSWTKGLDVEKQFLIDSVKIDSTAFSLEDGSGLAAGNLVTPHAFVQLLAYMYRHPKRAPFLAGLPRAQQRGSLLRRFAGTPLEGRVLAKTGSIDRVNTLSGYIEKADGRVITFSIQANAHDVPTRQMLAQIDSVVVQLAR